MKLYHRLREGTFLSRPNRFIAYCSVDGRTETVHVKNTGRCRELLLPGARVWLEESDNPARKTRFDLVCVESRGYVVNMDSQAPNRVFAEWAQSGGFLPALTDLRSEVTYGASRFDFAYRVNGAPGYAEVKGVTLFDESGMAYFPDAPTERGVKHLRELITAKEAGCDAAVCFVLQRQDVRGLMPNDAAHPAFGDALRDAHAAGVRIIAAVCDVMPDSLTITRTIPVIL